MTTLTLLIRIAIFVVLLASLPYAAKLAYIYYDRSWHRFEDDVHTLWMQCKDSEMEPEVNCHEWADEQYDKNNVWF